MRVVFYLHGELLMGDRGSLIVVLAASWAIVLILTGLYLWWPRNAKGLAGVLYPRLSGKGRLFWRDLHSVVGVWVSFFALFLLFTGLPWSASWGAYLKEIRHLTGESVTGQDWTTGSRSEFAQRRAMDAETQAALAVNQNGRMQRDAYLPLNAAVPTVAALKLAYPVLISPPTRSNGDWTAKSDAQNRTLRINLVLNPAGNRVIARQDFDQRPWLDRVIGTGMAAHEGQLFGVANQILGLCTALGLITLCISAIVMWWKRRPAGVLGAPVKRLEKPLPWPTAALIVLLCIYLPSLAASALLVYLLERFVLRRFAKISFWLGLETAHRKAL